MFELIKELSETCGISGDEGAVRTLISEKMRPLCEKIETDRMGNLICYKRGRDSSKRVLVDAHMDEVGLIISYITEDGLLKFQTVGGIDPRVLIGRKVRIGDIVGVISTKAVHLSTAEERKKAPDEHVLFIDIGATSKAEAEAVISLGDTAAFYTVCEQFGDRLIKGKALDNRIGCAAAICSAEQVPAFDTYYVFAVQEEVGLRGAYAGAYGVRPDFAIVVDTTTAADLPQVPEWKQACRLREGTVLFFMEGSSLYSSKNFEKSKLCAEKNNIRWQVKDLVAGGLDAGAIQRHMGGIEVLSLATPCRYLHSPACVASLADAEETARLLTALLADETLIEG